MESGLSLRPIGPTDRWEDTALVLPQRGLALLEVH